MPNAIKKFLTAGMFIFIVLIGTIFPLITKDVYARDAGNTFRDESGNEISGGGTVGDKYIKISAGSINDTSATLAVQLSPVAGSGSDEGVAKDLNNNKIFDGSEADEPLSSGMWDSVFDDGLQKSDDGILLELQKVDSNGSTVYTKIKTGLEPVDNTNKTYHRNLGSVNIGYLIFGVDPDKWFFGKNALNLNIPLQDLEANTSYQAIIVIEEDGSTDTLLSKPVAFKTLAQHDDAVVDPQGGPTDVDSGQQDQANQNSSLEALDCKLYDDGLWGCLALGILNLSMFIGVKVLDIAGGIFNSFIAISIGSGIYDTTKAAFVYEGWRISRDIANIFFIFVLLFTAIGTILGLHSVNYKKVVTQVILVAIFINFSMFMCRVIIDTGNILARVFYNQITLTGTGASYEGSTKTEVKEKDLAHGIVNGINPQSVLLKQKEEGNYGNMILIGLIFLAVAMVMAWTLFMSAAFFAGRIGVLWISMIFAPLAFVSTLVPSLGKKFGQIGWSSWFSSLTSAAFNAPIFMFFLYIILLLCKAGFESIVPMVDAANGSIEVIVVVILPLMVIVGLLIQAKAIAKEMAGQFAEMADGAFKGAIGLGAMAVTGGAAALGAKTLGANAMRTLNNQGLKDAAAGNASDDHLRQKYNLDKSTDMDAWRKNNASKVGKAATDAQSKLLSAKKTSERSFDLRQTGLGNVLSKATGVNMNTGSGIAKMANLDLGSDMRAGGAKAEADRRIKKQNDMEEILKGDPNKIHHLKEEKEEVEEVVKGKEEERDKINKEVQNLKDSGADKVGHPDNAAYVTAVAARKEKDKEIDTVKNGGVEKNAAGVITKVYGEKGRQEAQAKGMDAKDIEKIFNKTTKQLDKEINYEEKGRAKEYFKNKAHDVKKDTYGNAFSMKAMGSTLKGVLRDGLIGFAVGGPLGALAGSVVGASRQNGAVLNRLIGVLENRNPTLFGLGNTNLSGRAQSYEEAQQSNDPHYKAKTFKDNYKSPNKDFFKMFEGLGGGKGGGHNGGGDHGHDAGHDDGHGGGGGGHH